VSELFSCVIILVVWVSKIDSQDFNEYTRDLFGGSLAFEFKFTEVVAMTLHTRLLRLLCMPSCR